MARRRSFHAEPSTRGSQFRTLLRRFVSSHAMSVEWPIASPVEKTKCPQTSSKKHRGRGLPDTSLDTDKHHSRRALCLHCSAPEGFSCLVLLCKDHDNPTLLTNYRPSVFCCALCKLINIITTSRLRSLTDKYAVLESSQYI